ncbi:MAG: Roadblock/LC7 family protein [Frankiales bacterium]|nr:Roadblock/LC7 family protein [Frankiales bacterium]
MSEARPTSAEPASRAARLDKVLSDLRTKAPEIEAAAIVSFDGLPMVSDLPAGMDEDRVAAMCAALLSLGERASTDLGRGLLNQVYIEGETGTVFLIACDEEAVLVAVAAAGSKVGMMLYEVRRGAAAIAEVLAADVAIPEQHTHAQQVAEQPAPVADAPFPAAVPIYEQPHPQPPPPAYSAPVYTQPAPVSAFIPEAAEAPAQAPYVPAAAEAASESSNGWSSYAPSNDPTPWS